MKGWLSILAESIKECVPVFKVFFAANGLLTVVVWWSNEGNTPMPAYILLAFWGAAGLAWIIAGIVFLCELDKVRHDRHEDSRKDPED
jgi:hypothetical protein